jgi:hypothetical protein
MAVILGGVVIPIGCEKRVEPVPTTYQDELRRFIAFSEDGRELFSVNLFPDGSFYLDDTLHVFFQFDSVSRVYTFGIDSIPRDIYPFTDVYDAVVGILDVFYGNLYRIGDLDTAVHEQVKISIKRYAYFLKLYEDDYEYHGWRFWGYAADNPRITPYGTFVNPGGPVFSAFQADTRPNSSLGYYYIGKNNIPRLSPGASLTYTNSNQDVLFVETSDGKRHGIRTSPDGSDFKCDWAIPSATNRFFRLITIDSPAFMEYDTTYNDTIMYIDSFLVKPPNIVIPFKVNI